MKLPDESQRLCGWTACYLVWDFSADFESVRQGSHFPIEQYLRWTLSGGWDWEPGEPLHHACEECEIEPDSCGLWTMAISDDSPLELIVGLAKPGPFYKWGCSAIVELAGWGRTSSYPEFYTWSATDSYPLSFALVCSTCLSEGRIEPAAKVVVPQIGYDLHYAGVGCCNAHLADGLNAAENQLNELIPDDTRCGRYREANMVINPDAFARGRKNLMKFLVRVMPAGDVGSELATSYGVAQADVTALLKRIQSGLSGIGTSATPKAPPAPRKLAEGFGSEGVTWRSELRGLSKVAGMRLLKALLWRNVIRPLRNPAPFQR